MTDASDSSPEVAPLPSSGGEPTAPHGWPRIPRWMLCVLVLALAVWRIDYVLGGIDPDSDAHAHFVIARSILADPKDLSVHWVWLPLFHYLEAGAVWLGASMQAIRFTNVGLAALAPLVLFAVLEPRTAGVPAADVALERASVILACVLFALNPIAMQMGTTGQMEPLFCLLVLFTAWSLDRGRPGLAAIPLSAAVLLRYETWAVVPALLVHQLLARVPAIRRRLPEWERNASTTGARAFLPIVLPALAVFLWAAVRRATVDDRWLGALRQTREFANDAVGVTSSFSQGLSKIVHDGCLYLTRIPDRVMGVTLLLVPFGVFASFRRDGLRWFAIYGSILSFLTLTWLLRATLGLDRHFVAVGPFYALLAARGAAELARAGRALVRSLVKRFGEDRTKTEEFGWVSALVVGALGLAAVGFGAHRLDTWMRDWRGASASVWPGRRRIAATLVQERPSRIFCNEATVEVMSGLPREQFMRERVSTANVVAATAHGPVYLAVWGWALKGLELPPSLRMAELDRTEGTAPFEGFFLVRVEPR
ncbi:MAG: hypothetical protein FJ096_15125 [Deltaproteobacteria bacterium]|nr:hypothetical protein [Deltaproteobacteria bacterium]